ARVGMLARLLRLPVAPPFFTPSGTGGGGGATGSRSSRASMPTRAYSADGIGMGSSGGVGGSWTGKWPVRELARGGRGRRGGWGQGLRFGGSVDPLDRVAHADLAVVQHLGEGAAVPAGVHGAPQAGEHRFHPLARLHLAAHAQAAGADAQGAAARAPQAY